MWRRGLSPHPRSSKKIKVVGFNKKSCDQLDILLKGDCEESCSLQSDQQGELIHLLCCHLVATPHMTVQILTWKVEMVVFQCVPHLARSLSLLRCWKKDGSQMSCSSWHTCLQERPGSANLTCRALSGGHITCPWQKSWKKKKKIHGKHICTPAAVEGIVTVM